MVFVTLILFLIIYPLPAWAGQLTRQIQERLDNFLNKCAMKSDFYDENYTITELFDNADARLFRLIQKREHCPHHLLLNTTTAVLWSQDTEVICSFPHPQCKYNLYKSSFLRCLFKHVYQLWYLPPSTQDPLLSAGLPTHLLPLLLPLRFAFINYIYLLTYLLTY